MTPAYESIRYDKTGPIARLTFDRPGHRNALTLPMLHEVHDALALAAADPELRVLVVTGAGGDFCPGADLKGARAQADGPLPPDLDPRWLRAGQYLHEMTAVTIASIPGACAGAGLSWACACDLRIASSDARFNTAFLDVGASGDMGGIWFVTRLLGGARARELFLIPGKFDAAEARALGLVSAVHEPDALAAATDALAQRLAAAPPLTLAAMKANLVDAGRLELGPYLDAEGERHLRVMQSADTREAFAARAQKRPPRFTGR